MDTGILYVNGCPIPVEIWGIEMTPNEAKRIEIREMTHGRHYIEKRNDFDREMRAKYGFNPSINLGKVGKVYIEPKPSFKESDIKEVIINKPATIIKWADGTKTVVKCQDEDKMLYSPEAGVAIAVMKKVFGNKGNYNNLFDRLLKKAKYGVEK